VREGDVSDCWKLYSIVNVKESLVSLNFVVLNGCWERLWSETVNDIWGFPNQQHAIRNICLSVCNFRREVLPDVEEAGIQEGLDSNAAEITEGDVERLTALSQPFSEDTLLWRGLS
jgi:hypothetical protein